MLRTRLLTVAFAAASLAVVGVGVGCSSDPETPAPTAPDLAVPPKEAEAQTACTGADVTMAARKLYLGDVGRDGKPNTSTGWKDFGFDLDGKASTKESKDLCKPRAGGSATAVYPDGNKGIDNSFGKNILPILLGLSADLSKTANQSITDGDFTIMLHMEGIGTEHNCHGVNTKLYGGANFSDAHMGMTPTWMGSDAWPLLPDLLVGGDKNNPKIQFPSSYVVDSTWVSGSKGTVALALSISGFTVNLEIKSATIAVDLDTMRTSGTNGTISGVLDTEALVSQISKVAAAFDTSFCDPTSPTLQSILKQLEQASDILADGTQDPAKECNGISIGLGFDASKVVLGDVAPAAPPGKDPCAGGGGAGGAGTGGGGGAGGK